MLGADFSWLSQYCQQSQPEASDRLQPQSQNCRFSTLLTLSELQPEHLFSSYTCRALQDQDQGCRYSHTHCLSMMSSIVARNPVTINLEIFVSLNFCNKKIRVKNFSQDDSAYENIFTLKFY